MAKKKSNIGKMGMAGVAAAAAAAGAYYLYGSKNAAKNRAKTGAFLKKAEVRVVKEAKKGIKIAREHMPEGTSGKIMAKIKKEISAATTTAKKSLK